MKKESISRLGLENGQKVIKESDHNPVIANFNFFVKSIKKERR